MVEGDVEVKKNSSMGIVGELLRPFGSKAYKESRETSQGRLKSVIRGLEQAFMPATYSLAEKISSKHKERSSSNKELAKNEFIDKSAWPIISDIVNNALTLTVPGYVLARYVYGQFATRCYEK